MSNFVDFSCFVSMFPHLVAGPILKFSFLADQLKNRVLTSDKFARGVAFFMLGLAKKILLANPCGKIADTAFNAGSVGTLDAWFGSSGLRLPDLFRLQRLLRHGDRARPDVRLRLREKLRFALPRGIDHRFLAALAHLAFHLAARISLRPARRESEGQAPDLHQSRRHDATRRALARRLVEFRHLGCDCTAACSRSSAARAAKVFITTCPDRSGSRLTFLIVLLGWVFFRAADLPRAVAYLASMFGFGPRQPGAALLSGILYQPYYLLSLGHCRARRLGWETDLGLDATYDGAQDRRLLRARLARVGRPGHAGIQPVYLFHFLGTAS